MLSKEQGCECLEFVAAELKPMSYEQLEAFGNARGAWDDWTEREIQFCGETLHVNTMMGRLGSRKPRISVEIVVWDEVGTVPRNRCCYFERHKSGRLYPSKREETREATIVRSLPYLLVVIAAGVIAALLW